MKYRHLIIASAVSMACGSAFAQQSDTQQSDPGMTQSQSQDAGGASSMSPSMIKQVQQKLKQQGHEVGAVDGMWGPKTQAALREFQQQQGMQASGELDQETLAALGVQAGSGSQVQGAGGEQGAGGSQAQGSQDMETSQGAGGAAAQGNTSGAGGQGDGAAGAGAGSSQ
jgi:peptidoglycan hydrolase-like protein with peptidoglycan-binding domain